MGIDIASDINNIFPNSYMDNGHIRQVRNNNFGTFVWCSYFLAMFGLPLEDLTIVLF